MATLERRRLCRDTIAAPPLRTRDRPPTHARVYTMELTNLSHGSSVRMTECNSSIRERNARCTTAVKKHNHSTDDTLIQYRGKYSRHGRGQALTNFASDRNTGATCLKPSR